MAKLNGRVFLAVVLLLIGAGSTVARTSDAYSISSADTVNIPDSEVTVDGNSYPVTEIILKQTRSPISVSIDAPSDSSYDLYLYNHDRQVVAMKDMSGSGIAEFASDQLESGSYVLGIYGSDGTFKAVIPVVIAGYEVSVDAPSSVEHGSSFTVTADLTQQRDSPSPSKVEVVLSQDEKVVSTIPTTQASSSKYTATVEGRESGSYTVHVNVRGTEEAQGEKQIIGASQTSTVTVSTITTTEESTPGDSDPRYEDSQSGASDDGDENDTAGGSTNRDGDDEAGGLDGQTNDGDADQSTAAQTPTNTALPTSLDATDSSPTPRQSSPTSTVRSTTDAVLTPSQETTTSTTERPLPNSGLQLLILLLLVGGLFVRRRS